MSVNLASIEMRLLVVMDALLAEKSVSRAATRLGMSQPATSNALNRLRQLLHDPLFVRVGREMQPTARSRELAEPLSDALRQIENILVPQVFQPNETPWTFTLAVSEHASVVLLPALLAHLAATAPKVRVMAESHSNSQLVELLDRNAIDFAIGSIPQMPRRFARLHLYQDRYICLMRRDHPLAQSGRLGLEDFLGCEHLAINPGQGAISRVDQQLAEQGIRRTIFSTVHQFAAAPAIVARTSLLALMLERMMPMFDLSDLHVTEPPVSELVSQVDLLWSQPRSSLPAHRWMVRQIQTVTRSLNLPFRPGQPPLATEPTPAKEGDLP